MTSGLFDDLPVQAAPGREGGGRPRLWRAERGQVEPRAVSLEENVAELAGRRRAFLDRAEAAQQGSLVLAISGLLVEIDEK